MEPKIVEVNAKKYVGMKYFGDNKNNEILQLWIDHFQKLAEIKNNPNPEISYGISDDFQDGKFSYVACVEVTSFDNVPDGMVTKETPAGKYAVFTHKGKFDTLMQTYKNIHDAWKPELDPAEKFRDGAWIELYDKRFKYDSDDSEMDIYVPIK
jgi:AraC family transcriptional regulator